MAYIPQGELEGYGWRKSSQRNENQQEKNQVQDALAAYVREGAQQVLEAVLKEEVNAFLGRHHYG
jgi:F0F1-type ATP synthase membrane subunit b/b'